MSLVFEHERGTNPLGLAIARTIFIVNLCNQPECEHPILFTSSDYDRAESWLRERVAQETDPLFRIDLYRRDTLINDKDVFTPLLHVDANGEYQIG